MNAPSMSSAAPSLAPKRRCAVYTRKSTDEGLEQEYNSLEAQRDAGLAFVASQRHEGWIALTDAYDDGGYSGGTMERPALKRLLADIEARRVDVIVVYKIDRLSRSLADFARMVERFDANGVTFVSVTQQFNTTTSMGRLTLNILLSFAQFEREVTGERIRDKLAASKARGLWMGGTPPLGYDVRDRKLIVNPVEAELVRDIYVRYAEHGSAARLVRELQAEGHTTKSWTSQSGRFHKGTVIDQQLLFVLLRNRLYLGEMPHKGRSFPGQHEAIITAELWHRVQAVVERRRQGPRKRETTSEPALLAGLLYAPDGQLMLHTYTDRKNGKRYRYYVPYLDKRRLAGATRDPSQPRIGSLPAGEIEAVVLGGVFKILLRPEMVVATLRAANALSDDDRVDEPSTVVALQKIGLIWEQLFPAEQHRIVQLLVERVDLRADGLEIVWSAAGIDDLARESGGSQFVDEQRQGEAPEIEVTA